MRLRTFLSTSVLLVLLLVTTSIAQDTKKQADHKFDYAELSKAPEKSRQKQNPMAKDPEAVAAGGVLFEEHCQECHGANGEGTRKAPSLRAAEVQDASDGAIFWLLTNGVVRRGMPPWSKLPEPQRWQIIRYIKSLGTGTERKNAAAQPQ